MLYDDFRIQISGGSVLEGTHRRGRYEVRVLDLMQPGEAVSVEYEERALQRLLGRLERRELDRAGLIELGRTLAALLLPTPASASIPSVRELLARRLAAVGPDAGVRLRLQLPAELAVIPWEYAYVERAGGEGMDGFLALDPRIAIVRHEVLANEPNPPLLEGDVTVVVAAASADGLPELDLTKEMDDLARALRDLAGVRLERCEDATLDALQPALAGASIFHFAGHGDFTREMQARPGTYTGVGFLALADARVGAEQLGINLRGHGIRLAVLGGCTTGRRDGVSVWSGIAPALVKAEIPAVVANQYTITDRAAIAFSRQFYQALAGGLSIERAVTAGRVAAFNIDPEGRDWGVPVLYLRGRDGRLFAGATDAAGRTRAREAAETDVRVRAASVASGGVVYGAQVEAMLAGQLSVQVKVEGQVFGRVVGLDTRAGAAASDTQVDVGDVGAGGTVIGAAIRRRHDGDADGGER